MNKWYLAGPMSYRPQFNIPMFDRVALRLRKLGYDIVSPAELDEPKIRLACLASKDGTPTVETGDGGTWADFLARDVKIVSDRVGGIVLLPCWYNSRGARLEAFVGLLQGHDFKFMLWDDSANYPVPLSRSSVLAEIYNAMKETL